MTDHDFNILEGVYEDWDKVAADEGFFESDLWVITRYLVWRKVT